MLPRGDERPPSFHKYRAGVASREPPARGGAAINKCHSSAAQSHVALKEESA